MFRLLEVLATRCSSYEVPPLDPGSADIAGVVGACPSATRLIAPTARQPATESAKARRH